MKANRIYLRPLEISDAQNYQKSTKDEEIRYMTATLREFDLEEVINHIERIIKDTSREDYAICLNTNGEMVGELSLVDIDLSNKSAGFRISMNSTEHISKGLGTEAIELVIAHVFETLQLNRLQLEVFSHNERGIKAYEKAGFKQEGILREALFYGGHYSDEIIMSIIKSDLSKTF